MKYTKLILLLALLAILSACNDDKKTTGPSDPNDLGLPLGDYDPAKLGSKWEYSYKYNGDEKSYTRTVTGTRKFDAGEFVEFEEDLEDVVPSKSYRRYDGGKYYSLFPAGSGAIIGDFEMVFLDETAQKGDKWEHLGAMKVNGSNAFDKALYRMEYFDKLSTFKVNGVSYDDIIITKLMFYYQTEAGSQFLMMQQIYYYAKNVGLIKVIMQTDTQSVVQELISYTP